MDLLNEIPKLIQENGGMVALVFVLIYALREMIKYLKANDALHRQERDKQSDRHQANIDILMKDHAAERREWVAKIDSAAKEMAQAGATQADRVSNALTAALRDLRPR